MVRTVRITTPMPTLEEFGKMLGLSKKRQKSLALIVKGSENERASKNARKSSSTVEYRRRTGRTTAA
ncbi:hypothetical protein ACOBR2_12970 [Telmatobacter bradus]|uniref:hypothetical protein n=1 Tax=Telmatobacter bradus TaxID=474953 RepID=UPI003B4298AD